MKKIRKCLLLLSLIAYTSNAFSQQISLKVKEIDSLVKLINSSGYKIQRDTINQDHPEIGLSMQSYLTTVTDGSELKKYVNNVHATTEENGTKTLIIATNAFYFNHNELIKVEENLIEADKKIDALWYYADDKPIYYNFPSDKAPERAKFLLTTAKGILGITGFIKTAKAFDNHQTFSGLPDSSVLLDKLKGKKLLEDCSGSKLMNKVDTFWAPTDREYKDLEVNFYKLNNQIATLNDYIIQYIGIIFNGAKYIYINAFDKRGLKDALRVNGDLTSSPNVVCGGGQGFWRVLYEVNVKEFTEVKFNASK